MPTSAFFSNFAIMSKVCALYHVVINTKNRKLTIPESHKRELYKYLYGILEHRNCRLWRMNGISNHIHMLIDLHPSVALSELVQALKQGSSRWLKCRKDFPDFEGWGKEYYAFTVDKSGADAVIDYIKGQEGHHYVDRQTFDDEMKAFCLEYGIEWHQGALT